MRDCLDWRDLYPHLARGSGQKCWPNENSSDPIAVAFCEYVELGGYRSPSHAWPWSHARPLLTKKFAAWCRGNHIVAARKLELL
jgi:hypothetical protein